MKRLLSLTSLLIVPIIGLAGEPILTKREVVRLADDAAKQAGYNLGRYRPEAVSFDPGKSGSHDWIVLYDTKKEAAIGDHFFVHVNDQDRHTTISPGR